MWNSKCPEPHDKTDIPEEPESSWCEREINERWTQVCDETPCHRYVEQERPHDFFKGEMS
ncbi:hypothetical protein MAE02_62490 [Microvirga aerophila]|uniref:Uncharacterized protein n=1 Tax=Microvirga aerophila TaxID=670291 RepID=A0A512C2W0_9HYPH|nr:hypothetical protein MAE02_62490 [Microvirga aerophila]